MTARWVFLDGKWHYFPSDTVSECKRYGTDRLGQEKPGDGPICRECQRGAR